MKKLMSWIPILMSVVLFSACMKDNSYDATPNNAAKTGGIGTAPIGSTATTTANTNVNTLKTGLAGVNFQLTTVVPPNPLILWNSGSISMNSIAVDAFQTVGDMQHMGHFVTQDMNTVKLMSTVFLGTVGVDPGAYYAMDLGVQLRPASNAGTPPGMYLTGNISVATASGSLGTLPVVLIVNDPVVMTAQIRSNIAIGNNQMLNANLLLDLGKITNGITAQMLAQANASNGSIVISANSNQNLYQLILNNLQGSLTAKF